MNKLSVYFWVFLFIIYGQVTLSHAANQPLTKNKNQNTTKENITMTVSFSQRFANIQKNSLVLEKSDARGKDVKILQITGRDDIPESTDFLLYDSVYGVLCTSRRVYFILLQNGAILKYMLKEMNAPVVCTGYKVCFNTLMLRCIKPEDDEDNTPLYDIPGNPGTWCTLDYLFPFEDFFIYGVIKRPFPKDYHRYKLILGCSRYKESYNEIWSLTFDKPIPPPPVCNLDGNIIVFHNGTLRLISARDGSTIIEKPSDKEILSSSVGPNGRLYTVAQHDISHYLVEWDERFNEVASVEILRLPWNQPPITMKNGTVLLVTNGMVIAFRENRQYWQYGVAMVDPKHPFLATATSNNRIFLIAGTKLVCLDENGKELWVYRKEDAEPFRTQPVVGSDGAVYVADNKALYVVR